MLDGGESEVTGSAADCAADLVYYAAEGERLVGLVKTRRLAAMHPPSRCALRRTGKQQRAKAGMKPPTGKFPRDIPGKGTKVSATMKYG